MITWVVATSNEHKASEMRRILGADFVLHSLKDLHFTKGLPEEGVESYELNAQAKAFYVGEELQLPCLSDDSGFEVSFLNNEPGVLSARYAGTSNSQLQRRRILDLMEDSDDRRSRFVCAVSLYNPLSGVVLTCRGEVSGRVSREERGTGGFGYDSIFIPDGFDKTFAELSSEEKNQISHRSRALAELVKRLSV